MPTEHSTESTEFDHSAEPSVDTRPDSDSQSRPTVLLAGLALLVGLIFFGIWIASSDDDDEAANNNAESSDTSGEGATDGDPAGDGATDSDSPTIAGLFAQDEQFSTFAAALESAGMLAQLSGDSPFTVFAPANDAIEPQVLAATIASSTEDAERTLGFHLVEGQFTGDELEAIRSLDTVAGDSLRIFPLADGGGVLLNNGVLVRESIERSNGIVHVVEGLLVPPGVGTPDQTASGETTTSTTEAPADSTEGEGEDETEGETEGEEEPSTSSTTTEAPSESDAADLGGLATLDPILFGDNSAVIAEQSTGTLDRVVGILEANPDVAVEIGGHTDNIGPASGNQRLSERRASAVLDYLVEAGIDAGRLTAVGYGQDQPIESNDTAEGRAANRRIEFTPEN